MQQHLPMASEEPRRPAADRPAPARARRAVDWRIDARTRRAGMAGIAHARAALAATTREQTERRSRPSAA
jgi:hypothetical protein